MKSGKILIIIFVILVHLLIPSQIFSQSIDSLVIEYNYINTFPQNAEVYIDEYFMGNTPLHFISNKDSAKARTVKIKLDGYKDYIYKAGEDEAVINKTFILVSSDKTQLKTDRKLVLESKGSFFKSKRKLAPIILTAGFTVGSAVLSYYFEHLANQKYDEYLLTSNSATLDKTHKYDLISGISLATFQIGFASLIYFLLID